MRRGQCKRKKRKPQRPGDKRKSFASFGHDDSFSRVIKQGKIAHVNNKILQSTSCNVITASLEAYSVEFEKSVFLSYLYSCLVQIETKEKLKRSLEAMHWNDDTLVEVCVKIKGSQIAVKNILQTNSWE